MSTNAMYQTVGGSLTATGNLFSVDMSDFNSITVQVTSAGTTCTITYETSDDNTNWVSTSGLVSTQVGSSPATITSTTAIMLQFPKRGRWFRARVSTYTSGTVTAVGNMHKTDVNISNQANVGIITTLPSIPSGTAVIGLVAGGGITTTPGTTSSRIKAAATTNATNIKASAGNMLNFQLYNNTASAKFFKFYDKATAPTVGTDTPILTIIIPANGQAIYVPFSPIRFAVGISYAITGVVTDADTTATAVDDVHGSVNWI